MNKKTISLRDLFIYLFCFFLYFGGFLSAFLFGTQDFDASFSYYEQTVIDYFRKDDASGLIEFATKSGDKYIAVYLADTGEVLSTCASTELREKSDFNPTHFEKEQWMDGSLYRVRASSVFGNLARYGMKYPVSLLISRYFLEIGTPILFLVLLLSYLYGRKKLRDSFLALNSQVRKLQEVGGLSTDAKYEDSIDLLTKAVRQSRKAVDKELKEAELARQKNDFILDSFSQALIVINGDFKVEMFNKKASEIFVVPHEAALNADASFLDKVAPGLVRKAHLTMTTLIPSLSFETIGNRVFETAIEPLDFSWTQGERVNGASLLLVDVTDNYNSSSMKRDFFANASHELKSPLTSILGYQEMIRNGIITDPVEIGKATEKTIKDAKRMNKIIMDMLTLSSLENESLRPIEEITLSSSIEEILTSDELLIQEKRLSVHHKQSAMTIKMNEDDFDKLFRNLIENAIRYNKDGGFIDIIEDEKNHLVKIKDTGIGMKKEDCSRVFERFYRVDKARSRKNGGTGLGLAIAKYVCSYYNFSIDVESELNEGTTFIVRFK